MNIHTDLGFGFAEGDSVYLITDDRDGLPKILCASTIAFVVHSTIDRAATIITDEGLKFQRVDRVWSAIGESRKIVLVPKTQQVVDRIREERGETTRVQRSRKERIRVLTAEIEKVAGARRKALQDLDQYLTEELKADADMFEARKRKLEAGAASIELQAKLKTAHAKLRAIQESKP